MKETIEDEMEINDRTRTEETTQNDSTIAGQESEKLFVLSGLTDDEKAQCTDVINSLGGIVLDCQMFDITATHVITQKPSRSEKHLAAVASGKWLLCPAYLERSVEAGKFLPVSNNKLINF